MILPGLVTDTNKHTDSLVTDTNKDSGTIVIVTYEYNARIGNGFK